MAESDSGDNKLVGLLSIPIVGRLILDGISHSRRRDKGDPRTGVEKSGSGETVDMGLSAALTGALCGNIVMCDALGFNGARLIFCYKAMDFCLVTDDEKAPIQGNFQLLPQRGWKIEEVSNG